MPATESRKRCFPPVVDAQVRLLILGSLPGAASLLQAQYYAHRQNRFWHLLGEITETPLPALDYAERLEALLAHGIGLWDVVAEAQREGSLDSRIRDAEQNDLLTLLATLPQLQAIAFNGATAAKIGMKILGSQAARYTVFKLPSSSPAHTQPYQEKLAAWSMLRGVLRNS
jgi:hypoxanthine-DNA glycosylase